MFIRSRTSKEKTSSLADRAAFEIYLFDMDYGFTKPKRTSVTVCKTDFIANEEMSDLILLKSLEGKITR